MFWSGNVDSGVKHDKHLNQDIINEALTYGKPDVASLGDPVSKYAVASKKLKKAQDFMPDPTWRGGNYTDQSDVPLRRQAEGGPRPGSQGGKFRRKQSTQDSLRRADASMFNYDD